MKHLVLTPDSQLKLRPHFKLLAPKVTTSPNALRALLPKIGVANIGVHRLHEGVASSRFGCGAPVWAQALMKSRRYMKRPCYTIYDIEYLSGKAHERAAVIRRNDIRHHLHDYLIYLLLDFAVIKGLNANKLKITPSLEISFDRTQIIIEYTSKPIL